MAEFIRPSCNWLTLVVKGRLLPWTPGRIKAGRHAAASPLEIGGASAVQGARRSVSITPRDALWGLLMRTPYDAKQLSKLIDQDNEDGHRGHGE